MNAPPVAGWYDNPENPDELRYFDGVVWTAHTTPKALPSLEPAPDPTSALPTPGQAPRGGPLGPAPGSYGQYQQAPQPTAYGPGSPYAAPRTGLLPDGTALATWWQRLLARIIDEVITGVAVVLIGWPWASAIVSEFTTYVSDAVDAARAGIEAPDTAVFMEAVAGPLLRFSVLSIAVALVYEIAFLVWRGGTIGKLALGMRVREATNDTGGGLSLMTAIRRQFIDVGSTLLGFLPGVNVVASMIRLLDPAWLLWDKRRQALHDKVANTVVIRTR